MHHREIGRDPGARCRRSRRVVPARSEALSSGAPESGEFLRPSEDPLSVRGWLNACHCQWLRTLAPVAMMRAHETRPSAP